MQLGSPSFTFFFLFFVHLDFGMTCFQSYAAYLNPTNRRINSIRKIELSFTSKLQHLSLCIILSVDLYLSLLFFCSTARLQLILLDIVIASGKNRTLFEPLVGRCCGVGMWGSSTEVILSRVTCNMELFSSISAFFSQPFASWIRKLRRIVISPLGAYYPFALMLTSIPQLAF